MTWDTSAVEGLPAPSIVGGGTVPPSLIVRPFHQAGNVISLRQFTNNAFNHHHGIQSTERFGRGTDPDGDGVRDELTRADVTAAVLYQATMAVPGQVIPNDPDIEHAIDDGERRFRHIGCATCHGNRSRSTAAAGCSRNPIPTIRPATSGRAKRPRCAST